MKLIAAYVVRAKGRPTFEEANAWVHACLAELSANSASLPETIEVSGDVRISVSNLTQRADLDQAILEFVRDSGDDEYLDDATNYRVMTFSVTSESGDEPTAIALAFWLDRRVARMNPSVGDYVERGQRWEALGRIGDAFHSYFMGLDLAPTDPELLLRLAAVELQLQFVTYAYKHATTAVALAPNSPRAAMVLASSCLALVDSPTVSLEEESRLELQRLALTSAQRAAALAPQDDEARRLLNRLLSPEHTLRGALGFFEPGIAHP